MISEISHIIISFVFINFVIAAIIALLAYAYYNHCIFFPLEKFKNLIKKSLSCEKNKKK
jgi:hypothetical protein